MTNFEKALSDLLNTHCMENLSNTPDFLLAEYMVDCLSAFEKASLRREKWYDRSDYPGKKYKGSYAAVV